MKNIITILLLLGCSCVGFAQTNYYEIDKVFSEGSYTYQCDVDENSQMVMLYNKANQYTYVKQSINNGDLPSIGQMPDCVENDNWTKAKCIEIVNNAFSVAEKQRMNGKGITIAMYISPLTGKVLEVNFQFTTFSPAATIPLSVYRNIETSLISNVSFVPTSYGKKLNYIILWRRYYL